MKLSSMNEMELRVMVAKLLVIIKTEKTMDQMLNELQDNKNKFLKGSDKAYGKIIDLLNNVDHLNDMYNICLPYYMECVLKNVKEDL